ncbi:hypothetical protein D6D03_04468 [Aureobasidium pullulans]|nr:hypothetical protein D6D03_04468 [Aureobasidium pullulans]
MNARTGRASIDSGIALPFRSKPTKWRMFLDMPQELRFVVYEILLDLNAKAYFLIEPLLAKMTSITNLLWSSRQIRADIHVLLSRTKVRIMAGVLQDWTLRPYSLLRDHDMDHSGAMAHQAWSEFNKTVPFEFKFTRVLLSVMNKSHCCRITAEIDFETGAVRVSGVEEGMIGHRFRRWPPTGYTQKPGPLQKPGPTPKSIQMLRKPFIDAKLGLMARGGCRFQDIRLLLVSAGKMVQPQDFWGIDEPWVNPEYLR